jgi:hypothetical protein
MLAHREGSAAESLGRAARSAARLESVAENCEIFSETRTRSVLVN